MGDALSRRYSIIVVLLVPALCSAQQMQCVRVASNNSGFVLSPSGERFTPWGHN